MPVTSARLEVEVDASAAGTAEGVSRCERFLEQQGVPLQARMRLALVLEEVLMNVVMHGHAHPAGHRTLVQLQVHADGIELGVLDDGQPFDPRSAPTPARPDSVDQARPGGMGVPLIRRFSRSLAYQAGKGRNQLTAWLSL